jgi:hypothetical protein
MLEFKTYNHIIYIYYCTHENKQGSLLYYQDNGLKKRIIPEKRMQKAINCYT